MKLFNQGCTAAVLCAAGATTLPAHTFTALFNFGGTNGANPRAALVQGNDGSLYGTTSSGGLNCAPTGGCGTVFKITPSGTLTTLNSFCAFSQCPDGAFPTGPLAQTASGEFYGTTSQGGSSTYCASFFPSLSGCGVFFKMTPSGLLTILYNFCSQNGCADGASPTGGLIQGSDGDLYGITSSGGANNGGTIFKITTDGNLTTLYSFCSSPNGCLAGQGPNGGLVQTANGDLYGTTYEGGSSAYCASIFFNQICGTVFKITRGGVFTSLYSFCAQSGCTDGASPSAGLVLASNGDLYGTTLVGGTGSACSPVGCGTVFKVTSSGALTTLYSFTVFAEPSGLIQATDGDLYGTTFAGPRGGTVFKITLSGSFKNIFNPPYNLGTPLVQDTNGSFYGTNLFGGAPSCFCGIVYSLSVGLGPFIKLEPASGGVGEAVEILGDNLTGTTAVSFDGTPATFKVASKTLITTNVPPGATSGKVQVTTPSGTLASNTRFRVRQ